MGLRHSVLNMPQRIDPVITHNSPASAYQFTAFTEVLDIWYIIKEAGSIRNTVVDAHFVDLRDNEYYVYVKVPDSWNT